MKLNSEETQQYGSILSPMLTVCKGKNCDTHISKHYQPIFMRFNSKKLKKKFRGMVYGTDFFINSFQKFLESFLNF